MNADDGLGLLLERLDRRGGRRSTCPSEASLAAWSAGMVEAGERAAIESHLSCCDLCRQTVEDEVDAPAMEACPPLEELLTHVTHLSTCPTCERMAQQLRATGLLQLMRARRHLQTLGSRCR